MATRLANWALNALVGLALVILLGLGAAHLLDMRPMVVRSDSMRPTFRAGDVIIVQSVSAASVRPGQIVTFHDPTRGGQIVSHRLRRVVPAPRPGRLAMTTQGDANTGTEEWQISERGSLGSFKLRLPGFGYAWAWLRWPWLWLVLVLGALGLALHLIWVPGTEKRSES
jgi:signal peptidase